jgi:hypothetical protein
MMPLDLPLPMLSPYNNISFLKYKIPFNATPVEELSVKS